MAESKIKIVAVNKKARHEYEFIDTLEAGVSLTGSEVKSLRQGKVSLKEGYVRFENNEAWLLDVDIAPYEHAGYAGHEPTRKRKLLLHATEIKLWSDKVDQKGLSVVPVKIYLRRGRFKIELALARGKKIHDRRQELKRRDMDRDMERQLSRY